VQKFLAKEVSYEILHSAGDFPVFPYLRSENGDKKMLCTSPLHGRSFVVGKSENGRYVVSKGNGLSYSAHTFLNTVEMGMESWGLLVEQAAVRDFLCGIEIQKLDIKTNQMEYVLRLKEPITFNTFPEETVEPILLQYSVECPYRICDVAFMEEWAIACEVMQWDKLNYRGYNEKYMIAADVLLSNLRKMHDNNILHNAIHIQNYTWALELLDFELTRTPNYQYGEEDEKYFTVLYHRELIQTYDVINYIAWCLREKIDYKQVDSLFKDYGFDLAQYGINK
jgi:hypothetical protein